MSGWKPKHYHMIREEVYDMLTGLRVGLRKRRFSSLLLAFAIMMGALVIPQQASAADYTVQKWQTVEISLTSSKTYTNPFQDVDVTATFSGPGGVTITRPAFWNGGAVWKVRFAPTVTGAWTMTTAANDTTDTGLHNVTKTIQADAYTGSQAIYQKGFLKVSSNGRYLTYNDGTPFFYLGDTHWILPHERFSTSNKAGVASQFKYVVDKRVGQGFTVYQSEPIWQPHGGGTHTGADEEAVANLSDGFSSTDLPGFDNLDRKFKYIADQGLVHANAQVTWALDPASYSGVYTDAYMARVAKYWVARYGSYPVIWTIAQEIDRNMYNNYNTTTMSKWYAVGQSISDNDAYNQPLMPHMENTGTSVASNSTWASKAYHDGWAVQWQGDMTGMSTAKDFWNFATAKPSVMYESAYDGFWTDSRGALGAAYKSFQYGIYGYGYGASGTWNDVYSVSGAAEDFGTGYELPARYTWWYDGANYVTGDQLTYFKNYYTSLEWWKLVPRFDDASWGAFSDTSRSLLSSDGNSVYSVFFFNGTTSTGTLKQMDNAFLYNARWFNPRTGGYTAISSSAQASSGQWNIPAKPDSNDWVLLVQKTSTPAPNLTNMALGKTYSSSSSWDANQQAPKAFDGTTATNWQACNTCWNGQWLEVNFGANTTFNKVVLTEYDSRTTGYRIEYWNGSAWQTAYTGTSIGASFVPKTITFSAVTGSKARIYFTSGTANAPIIYEFEIYYDVPNLALGKTYSSSSSWDANQQAPKAFDGTTATNWQACSGCWSGQWLEVNFGANTTFNKVVLTEYDSRTTGYRIEYWNGSSWVTAYTGTSIGASGVPKVITFSAVTGSKARIYYTSGTSYAPIIYEFEVYNQ
ncbi:DUF4038 domain-containing protein [Paenibacillus lignilyticus]|uniref:DUF4038 domain-containing protein n=1 Tax=Paenibacillus lignilyticus TaxID=1172615 RepID=A0ABS5C6P7_9BACL|nr:DUF4038 domain-containing protein [Paenibacillus lignilyticus]MBP3963673.1 DUF4038 domain-containing protein [Paenibacillus lignilyticus]